MHPIHFHPVAGAIFLLCERPMCPLLPAEQRIAGSAMNERKDVTTDDQQEQTLKRLKRDPEAYRP